MNQFQNSGMYRNQRYNGNTPQNGGSVPPRAAREGETQQNWMNNPALAGIDPARLQMLASLASQAQGKNQNELLPFLMAAASQANENNMTFRPDEISAIINVMKIGKSPQEIQKIDQLCALMRQFRR